MKRYICQRNEAVDMDVRSDIKMEYKNEYIRRTVRAVIVLRKVIEED